MHNWGCGGFQWQWSIISANSSYLTCSLSCVCGVGTFWRIFYKNIGHCTGRSSRKVCATPTLNHFAHFRISWESGLVGTAKMAGNSPSHHTERHSGRLKMYGWLHVDYMYVLYSVWVWRCWQFHVQLILSFSASKWVVISYLGVTCVFVCVSVRESRGGVLLCIPCLMPGQLTFIYHSGNQIVLCWWRLCMHQSNMRWWEKKLPLGSLSSQVWRSRRADQYASAVLGMFFQMRF